MKILKYILCKLILFYLASFILYFKMNNYEYPGTPGAISVNGGIDAGVVNVIAIPKNSNWPYIYFPALVILGKVANYEVWEIDSYDGTPIKKIL